MAVARDDDVGPPLQGGLEYTIIGRILLDYPVLPVGSTTAPILVTCATAS